MLDWFSDPGFKEFANTHDLEWHTALEFRQRYLINALRGRVPVR